MPPKWTFHESVPAAMDNRSLKALLHEYWLLPKHLVFSIRKAERVLVNGRYQPINFPVKADDQITMTFLPSDFRQPFPSVLPDPTTMVEVLYEDQNLIVINKRRGDKTHPNQPGETGATINHLAAYLKSENGLPYMVHRLDQETSGAIIFAKNPAVVPILVANIAAKRIQRTYLAWVSGRDLPATGTITLPIGLDPTDKRKRAVNGPHAAAATTHYHVVRKVGGNTLLEIRLETGRTHQIRVHLAAIGHPLIGDPLYNDTDTGALMLHSWKVGLVMPFTNQLVTVTAPIPNDFHDFERRIQQT
ncbi:RluA family pseudouridine synthase [Lentilactobacillus parafarraginis]|nr:RluA family pseudouridine synthase [Lentilactobacillus parafarraginis]TLQ19776.1 RluA family pseudouridine synthase [Lentilactobacillus parafarraginis]